MSAFRAGRVGDAAAYKAAAIGARAYPEIEARLKALADPLPQIDLATLRQLPAGTFGRAYADHMDCKGLRPLVVSPSVAAELAGADILAIRYAVLHDTFHVLLDFDTDLSGELGVWAFVSKQRYSPRFRRAGILARALYTVVAPIKFWQLKAAQACGERMASEAACLIAEPIQTFWNEHLPTLRHRLGIRPVSG
ncbi:Coq4 family protein [Usitatibacter palustris]|uniref:Coq4 family protein n=1 Tax=Usitatibacter palustris TaxID=2732487 RepID=UPI0014888E89|nr:Coq4 family protein [Usitatibacter palustris]